MKPLNPGIFPPLRSSAPSEYSELSEYSEHSDSERFLRCRRCAFMASLNYPL